MKKNQRDPRDVFEEMMADGKELICFNLVDPPYWYDKWEECPLCGSRPNGDGTWVHEQKQ